MARSRLEWRGDEVLDTIARRTVTAIDATNRDALEVARDFTPVLTGYLRSRWALVPARVSGDHVIGGFGNDAPYYRYVEFGTTRMRRQPMVGPAIDRVYPTLRGRIGGST